MVGRIRCSNLDRSGAPERLLGRDRPHEPGELARAGDDDLLGGLAAGRHPLPASIQALLTAPGTLDGDDVLAYLATAKLVADGRSSATRAQPTLSAWNSLVSAQCLRSGVTNRRERESHLLRARLHHDPLERT